MDKKSFLLGTLTGDMTRGQVFVTPRESLTKISTENALEYLASGKGFILDRIGDARNLNKNLENNL